MAMSAVYPGRKTFEELTLWTPSAITVWRSVACYEPPIGAFLCLLHGWHTISSAACHLLQPIRHISLAIAAKNPNVERKTHGHGV
jgi:hypothetical protein